MLSKKDIDDIVDIVIENFINVIIKEIELCFEDLEISDSNYNL